MAVAGVADAILHSSDRHHLMLLYDDELERNAAEIECINHSLEAGRYCVYASVDLHDKEYLSKVASRITGFDRHVKEGDLSVVDFMPFYGSASSSDMTPFNQLKEAIEKEVAKRVSSGKSGKVLIVADAACNLAKHMQFDECVHLERWWQNTYVEWKNMSLDVTIICAHPLAVLREMASEQSRISHAHSLALDLKELVKPAPIRILVAESDPDMRLLYKRYLDLAGIDLVAVRDAKDCLEKAVMPNNDNKFDLIIIDSHIKDFNGLHVAKKILEEKPEQAIVFTTTWSRESISSELRLHSLDPINCSVLEKPFSFTQLLSLIKPAKT
jgi:CheY-like chemotaxis protein